MDLKKGLNIIVILTVFSLTTCQGQVNSTIVESESEPVQTKPKNFFDSFLSGFGLIFVSEVGDKTFFLTILYAMEHNLLETILVTSAAMCSLNLVSISIGFLLPIFLYRNIIDWIGIVIFTIFGFMMLYEAFTQEKDESLVHDLEDLQKELEHEKEKDDFENVQNQLKEPLNPKKAKIFTSRWAYVSGLIIAEMGDKSQISAIVLGAINNFYGVLLGTTLAFILCIVLSSITGKELSAKLTHKQLTLLGGCMFLLFALIYFIEVTGFI
jgi:putative Ca2+/H+ antiporter (TMEM165/GDT1 family)